MTTLGIYVILNTFNDKVYVGSSINLKVRWQKHLNDLTKNIHDNRYLQAAYNKQDKQGFMFVVIEFIQSKPNLVVREQHWIDTLNAYGGGYNLRPKAESQLGFKHSEETKNIIRVGKLNTKASDETKIKMSLARKNIPQTPDWIAKRAAKNIGRVISKEHIDIIKETNSRPDKWPHGWQCLCNDCTTKRNLISVENAKNRKLNIKELLLTGYIIDV